MFDFALFFVGLLQAAYVLLCNKPELAFLFNVLMLLLKYLEKQLQDKDD